MNRLVSAFCMLVFAAPFIRAQTTTWVSDPNHSEVDFAITHMSISKVHGRFGSVSATIQYNAADITKSTVQATIGVGTVDTGVQSRDSDLKSANYFDISTYPAATFTSTTVSTSGSGLSVSGNLTLHGVTKSVVLDVQGPSAPVKDQRNRVHRGFSASTTIKRTDFAIGSKVPAVMLGDEVQLTIELDVIQL